MELPKNQLEQLELERKANNISPIRQNFSGIGCLQGASSVVPNLGKAQNVPV